MIPMEVIKERLERYEKELPLGRLAEMPMEIGTVLELIQRVEEAEQANRGLARERDRLRDDLEAADMDLLGAHNQLKLMGEFSEADLEAIAAKDSTIHRELVRQQVEKNAALRENEALRREMLTPKVFTRLVEWLRDPNPKNASGAFTAGMERQIAYALEMDVLPEVKSLRIKLANAEKDIQKLRSGEFICQKCGLRKDADRPGEVPF